MLRSIRGEGEGDGKVQSKDHEDSVYGEGPPCIARDM